MTDETPGDRSSKDPESDPAFADLDTRIREARRKEIERTPPDQPHGTSPLGLALGMRIGIEMMSALAVSGVIGWYLDQWLETRPWIMLAMLVLGSAAGLMNAYRAAMRASAVAEEESSNQESSNQEQGDQSPRNEE